MNGHYYADFWCRGKKLHYSVRTVTFNLLCCMNMTTTALWHRQAVEGRVCGDSEQLPVIPSEGSRRGVDTYVNIR